MRWKFGAINRDTILFGAALVATVFTASHRATASTIKMFALSGTTAPDSTAYTGSFSAAQIAADGSVVFLGNTTSTGIWKYDALGIGALVAKTGNGAVDSSGAPYPGGTYNGFSAGNPSPALSQSGDVAFVSVISGISSSINKAYFSDVDGTLKIIAQEGTQVPGLTTGTIYSEANNNLGPLNNNGYNAFFNFAGGGTTVVMSNAGGSMAPVIATGNAAPGISGGTFANGTASSYIRLNDDGRVAFAGNLVENGGTVTSSNNTGLWTGTTSANLSLLIREGDAATGITSAFFGDIQSSSNASHIAVPAINGGGQVAFAVNLTGSGVTGGTTDTGMWISTSGTLTKVMQSRIVGTVPASSTPGTFISGASFNRITSNSNAPLLADNGELAFVSLLTMSPASPSNDSGIWRGSSAATLALVVREGDSAAGIGGGVLYGGFLGGTTTQLAVNPSGNVAFLSSLTGTGVTTSNDVGLFYEDPTNGDLMTLAVREGDL